MATTLADPGGLHPRPSTDFSRLLLGLVVVAVGGLYLLQAAGVLDASDVLSHAWPAVFVGAGVLTLFERPRGVFRGVVLIAGGAVGLLFTTDVLGNDAWKYIWPAAVLLAGVSIIWRFGGRTVAPAASSDDVVRTTALFGGSEQASASQNFHGGWMTAVFGGAKLDLRDALPAPEGATINATTAFGGIDILVPRGWHVTARGVPIFGGIDDKVDRSQPVADDAPHLVVDAICVFGGVSIKHEK